ncbi:coagulation factor 5/8 type domain protein [Paenibacillus curdlanolyticus YK9]|uniref:Coagulation factor 5/8 type domain protein n=1 Tax=Paenibacillus curdlanolyticus YK9 TaxID=717606 RepID=E0I8A3_9BACL|nr:discoidin domain-containing protein [Paenibacillus curdlanolyticus]EFM11408.1 coagulation factor 5/8 type domain protein [Paenibacillus curdlanolyticus YK9]
MLKKAMVRKSLASLLLLSLAAVQAPLAASVSAASQTYEAEAASLAGGAAAAADHTGYTGTGFVGGYTDSNKGNASTTFSVSASSAGSYTAVIKYANGTGSAKTVSLYVNGAKVKQISLAATASWDTWGSETETVSLNAGSNTIMYKYDSSDSGNVNIDSMTLNAPSTPAAGTNLALNAAVSSNNNVSGFTASNAVDGNASTYYEGAANAYPNVLTVDLGSAQNVNSVVLKLPAGWGTRTQTLSVQGSSDNSAYSTLAASATYTFNPTTNNTVTITFTEASARYVRLSFTANSGATGGQASEFEVYGTGASTTTPPPVTPPPAGTYGATMPYDTYEAESLTHTGTVIGPSTSFGNLAAEASGRKAVQLTSAGQYVQFTLAKAAKGITIRYSIPDNASGTGIDSAISLYAGGTFVKDVNLTSKYSWNYGAWGTEGGEIRWSNNPNATPNTPLHNYDEASVVLNQEYPAGTVIKLQRNASNLNFSSTANVTVDLIETEAIPAALSMPSNYVSILNYGAVANDGADDTTAFNNAINAVKNSGGAYKGVWIPSGNFTLNNGTKGAGYNGTGTRLYLDSGVSVKGAGIWYSTVSGNYAGFYLRGGNVTLSDFKISANDLIRDDYSGVSGVEGNGTNSTLTNLWIEHTKVGFWLTNQTNNATISNSRIRNVWADGLNLHYGTTNSTVTNNSVRNSGDDGLAMWSDTYLDTNNTFSYNTVQIPTLANNIAIYGGKDNKVLNNLLTDTVVNGSGISYGTNFNPPSMTGTLTVQNNVLIRCGSLHKDYGYQIGAIWAYWVNNNGKAQNLTVNVSGNTIQDSTYSGIFIEEPAPGITVNYASNTITNAGTYGVYVRGSATGSSTFTNNTVNGAPSGKFLNTSPSFTVSGSGNNW